MGTTPHLGLNLPAAGSTGWNVPVNANFSLLDTVIYALQEGGTTGPAGPTGPAGSVGMIFAGQWVSTTAYVIPDVVTYNGSSYLAIANNSNKQPDTNPNTWAPLALAGAAGPAGPTGPQGPQGISGGGGSSITYPITVVNGGTGANSAAQALLNLGAAASGANDDIQSLADLNGGITIGVTPGGADGYLIVLPGPDGNITAIGNNGISMSGNILCGAVQASGGVTTNQINPASGSSVTVSADIIAGLGLIIQGTPGAVAAGQVSLGGAVATTASAGGGQALPATVLCYIDCFVNIEGTSTPGKIPILAS
jgi:hypothetical protein